MAEWSGILTGRRRRVFLGRADIWQPSDPLGATGGEDKSYGAEPHLANVPYYMKRESAIDNPELIALVESNDKLTIDVARFPPRTPLGSSWIIVDRSLTFRKEQGVNWHQGWICRGEPVSRDDMDRTRTAGAVSAYVTRQVELPDEIKAYYAE